MGLHSFFFFGLLTQLQPFTLPLFSFLCNIARLGGGAVLSMSFFSVEVSCYSYSATSTKHIQDPVVRKPINLFED